MINRRPHYFSQRDPAWANLPYQADGEHDTIKNSGCGPTCAAMLISTITGKLYTPVDACRWSVAHGYKAKGQGTYYSYFAEQFAACGIQCKMLNWSDSYHKPDHPNHNTVRDLLHNGWYAIALMRKGLWTPSGHFVVLWWEDDKALICDPNSTARNRTVANLDTFRNEVKYYWIVDGRAINHKPDHNKEEMELTKKEVEEIIDNKLKREYDTDPAWGSELREWVRDNGIADGSRPNHPATRLEVWAMLKSYTRFLLYVLRKAAGEV